MGTLILQMMMTADAMLTGPKGEMDWIAQDEPLNQDHLARLQQAEVVMMGSGASSMSEYWKAAEHDEKAKPIMRAIGRAMSKVRKVVYSHKEKPLDWDNAKVHVVRDDAALVKDVQHLKQETKGPIVCYGGVRFARTLLQQRLLDEMVLDVCPVVLGAGERLFPDLKQRANLRLLKCEPYESGAIKLHYRL